MGLSFRTVAGPRQRSNSRVRVPRGHIPLWQIQHSPNLEDQVPVFISPRNRVAQLYPEALGSRFVASYDSQRWRYSTPASTRADNERVRVTLRLAVYRQSIHLGAKYFFNWTLVVIVLTYHPLWREDGSIVYNWCWLSTAQSTRVRVPQNSWPYFTVS
jgi:hypothetical protein